MKDIGKKILFFIFIYLIYQNIFYVILVPEIYFNPIYVVYLIIAYMVTLADTLIRSIPEERHPSKIFSILILLMILLSPFFLIAAFLENQWFISQILPFWDNIFISYIGFILYLTGSFLIIVARAQIGRFGTGELITEKDHQLFTQGVYRYIRNPMYSGALIATIGFCLVFRCIITLIIMFIYSFLIYRMRIIEEEKILQEKFGSEFEDYKKNTKRLIPFVY
ncbi:MAG: methyltransferase family protein [Candidatus Hermodarchaeota archaeon]